MQNRHDTQHFSIIILDDVICPSRNVFVMMVDIKQCLSISTGKTGRTLQAERANEEKRFKNYRGLRKLGTAGIIIQISLIFLISFCVVVCI